MLFLCLSSQNTEEIEMLDGKGEFLGKKSMEEQSKKSF
jgi:hypothetical protein